MDTKLYRTINIVVQFQIWTIEVSLFHILSASGIKVMFDAALVIQFTILTPIDDVSVSVFVHTLDSWVIFLILFGKPVYRCNLLQILPNSNLYSIIGPFVSEDNRLSLLRRITYYTLIQRGMIGILRLQSVPTLLTPKSTSLGMWWNNDLHDQYTRRLVKNPNAQDKLRYIPFQIQGKRTIQTSISWLYLIGFRIHRWSPI